MKLKKFPVDTINSMNKNTLMEQLDIKCVEIGDDYVVSTMPVNSKTHQPMGLLHGGASAALIESIASMGSTLLIDIRKEHPVGLEINANHIFGQFAAFVFLAVCCLKFYFFQCIAPLPSFRGCPFSAATMSLVKYVGNRNP